jgi:hypothetical protein
MGKISMSKRLIYGLIGGVVSTIVMDLLSMIVFTITGKSFPSFFAMIGSTPLTLLGIHEDFPLWQGLVLHYSIGILLGIAISLGSEMIKGLHLDTRGKAILISVIPIEVIGFVLFYLMSVILAIPQADMMVMYLSGIVLHGIGGICLGLLLYYGKKREMSSPLVLAEAGDR